ncbi:MAG TPA: DMT family transporter [Streptosporangiaceae bacterium]|jgi:drug/metabolite transporter (DMT)-like permease|nr:DMT family transporter [Streptosporangiaceae bacterium]
MTTARLALLAVIWGSSFLWIKLSLRGLSPLEVTFARLVLGTAVLLVIVAVKRYALPRSPVMWAHIAVAAAFGNAAPYLLFALSEQKVASSTAGILNATTPLWTVVIALATRHERFVARRGIGPVALSAGQLLVASVFLAVGLGVAGAPAPRFGVTVAVSIATLGLLCTGVAYMLNYQIITSEGATAASTVTYLLPVVAIILGVAVLGERITASELAGVALILAGVALARRRAAPGGEPGDRPLPTRATR